MGSLPLVLKARKKYDGRYILFAEEQRSSCASNQHYKATSQVFNGASEEQLIEAQVMMLPEEVALSKIGGTLLLKEGGM